MEFIYLKDIQDEKDLKKKYRTWSKKLHPDMGGTEKQMSQLNNEKDHYEKYGFGWSETSWSKTVWEEETIWEKYQRASWEAEQREKQKKAGRQNKTGRTNRGAKIFRVTNFNTGEIYTGTVSYLSNLLGIDFAVFYEKSKTGKLYKKTWSFMEI